MSAQDEIRQHLESKLNERPKQQEIITCPTCNGSGLSEKIGVVLSIGICSSCQGQGLKVIEK